MIVKAFQNRFTWEYKILFLKCGDQEVLFCERKNNPPPSTPRFATGVYSSIDFKRYLTKSK